MRSDKEKTFNLRRQGWSYNAIHAKLGVPKSTLSDWFSDETWSKQLRENLTREAILNAYPKVRAMNEAHSLYWEQVRGQAREEARKEFFKLRDDPLFIAGIMLYWGEGEKRNRNSIRLGNSDPAVIKIFTEFLRKVCNVPKQKICFWLLLYPDLKEDTCKGFWIESAKLDGYRFNKSIVIIGRHKKRKLGYGVCTVVVGNTYLKVKILEWMNLFSKNKLRNSTSIAYRAAIV